MNRDTICVQGGYTPGNGEPRQIPIIQSTTFKYATSEDMGKLFDLEADGYFYSRLQNPTCDLVAKKICELEGGTAAMLTSSGQAANFFALFNICQAGDHIVSSSSIYGGTFNLISVTMAKMGIEATFVSPDATEEEIFEALEIAQAKEVVLKKEDGLDTEVEQGGKNFSGGQRQRLSIARAIAKKPKIFLFDDSFSALDYKTDVALRRALEENISDATQIIVAQRISTVLHANQILVLDEGRLVGKGTHAQLMASCPEYQEIARSQLSQKELDLKSLNTEKEGE